MNRMLPYARLVRLPNTFTAQADIFLGALATGFLLSRWNVLLCLLAASTLLYWSGMVWNDYFDLDQDRLERPGRPLAAGHVPLRVAFWLGVGLMLGGLLMALVACLFIETDVLAIRWRPLMVAGALVIAILLYDGVWKATWAGPVLMGLCRFLNVLLGLSILAGPLPFWGWLLALIVGTYIAGVTWFARTEARTSNQPMLIAAALVILASLTLALTMPALALETTPHAQVSRFFPYLLAAFGVYLGIAVLRAINRPDPNRVQPAVKRAVLGLIVLDALMASAFVDSLGLLLVVLLIPGMILGRWLYST
jgi:4-hydroxybenzoate polyprenyltransferase